MERSFRTIALDKLLKQLNHNENASSDVMKSPKDKNGNFNSTKIGLNCIIRPTHPCLGE